MNEEQIQIQLLKDKLQLWRNTLYSFETDAKIASRLTQAGIESGKQMMEQATQEMKRCTIAIETIQELIAKCEK